jgi:hypothetical protein
MTPCRSHLMGGGRLQSYLRPVRGHLAHVGTGAVTVVPKSTI